MTIVDQPLERRKNARSEVAVDVKLHAPSRHFMLLSRTIDISHGGAFVRSSRTLPVGESITVQFDRGGNRNPLTFEAEVVRVGQTGAGHSLGMGIQFLDISDLDEALIGDLIAGAHA